MTKKEIQLAIRKLKKEYQDRYERANESYYASLSLPGARLAQLYGEREVLLGVVSSLQLLLSEIGYKEDEQD